MARQKADIDWDKLNSVLKYKPSIADAAEIVGVSIPTLMAHIKEKTGLSFLEYRETKMAQVRISLVQKALEMAIKGGNTAMMIFCLKNMCKWRDDPSQEDIEALQDKIIIQYKRKSDIIVINETSSGNQKQEH